MNLTDDHTLKFLSGTPVLFEDICAVYPVTLKEIVDIGYDKFQQYLNILMATKPLANTKEQNEFTQLLEVLTDFQYLLLIISSDPSTNLLFKDAIRFFTHEEILISLDPAQIIIGPVQEKHILNEEKFYEFQRLIKRMYFIDQDVEDIIIYENDSPATKKLKMQMRANREKVRKAKAKQAAKEGKSNLKFSDLIGSMALNNCGLNINNIWNISYYAFHDQLKRMGWRDQFNINNSAALAGAKINKSQLKHWMRSIADSEKS